MATATTESPLGKIVTEPHLLRATLEAVSDGLGMCAVQAPCVGVSSVPPQESGVVTGMIGVHGNVSGFVTVSWSERFAIKAVEGLLSEEFGQLNSEVIDGVGEITNIIVGGIKSSLAGTGWAFPNITVPSVIVGSGYQIAYAKGLEFLCVTFLHNDPEAFMARDRLLQVSISLLKL